MDIILDDNHKLTSDKYNYIIKERKIYEKGDKKGEVYWKQLFFYPKLEQAVAGYCEHFLLESSLSTLDGLGDAVRGLRSIVESIKETK